MSWNQPSSLTTDVRDERVSAFLSKVYAWMFLGLLITAGTALVVSSSPALVSTIFVEYRFVFWAIVLAQFGLVV